jgi:hypothetical protein
MKPCVIKTFIDTKSDLLLLPFKIEIFFIVFQVGSNFQCGSSIYKSTTPPLLMRLNHYDLNIKIKIILIA